MHNTNRSNNESLEHHLAKRYVMDSIVKGKLKVNGSPIGETDWEYISIEAILDMEGKSPYKDRGLTVDDFNQTKVYKHRHTYYENEDVKQEAYYSDPVNFCTEEKKKNIKIKYMFDIGIYGDGKFKYAIELVKTSKVTADKMKYCKENGITVIEIPVSRVIPNFRYNHVREDELNMLEKLGHVINATIYKSD